MSELIDNRTQRLTVLKNVIQQLHSGTSPDIVRGQLRDLVRQTDASEIMAMEQQLIAGGMRVEEIQSMCDLHSQVTREILVQLPGLKPLAPGHPVDTFRRENKALQAVIDSARTALAEIDALDDEADSLLDRLRRLANDLTEVDKHYQRKEHALFSCLERHGISGPSKVMWAKDDEVRGVIKAAVKALRQCAATPSAVRPAAAKLTAAISAVQEMINKEENILLPMALQTLTEEEWAEVWLSSPQYGWCLVEPQSGYAPPSTATENHSLPITGNIQLPSGSISIDQLSALLSVLPVDITFVDADDRVAFFSEGPERVFARSRAIIGRKVQHCHPPRSVETVERILADFREGRQSVAEFWINSQSRFIHIRYFAVRDSRKNYMGTLEVTQDVTSIRALEGERRLLQYGTN